MRNDAQIKRMKSYRVECIKKLLKMDLDQLVKEIKPLSSILGSLYGASLLLNINCNWHYDDELVDSLKDEDIEKLIKILLHYEKLRFQGSVSAIPNLLRKLKIRNYKKLQNVVDWVIEKNANQNPWIPTGRFKDQPITTNEYLMQTF